MLSHAELPMLPFKLLFNFVFQYVVSLDQGRFACLTIKGVSMEDSGRYTMIVQNKYGGESVDIVVSVTAVYHKWLDLLKAMKFSWASVVQILYFYWGLTVYVAQACYRADIWPCDFCLTPIWQCQSYSDVMYGKWHIIKMMSESFFLTLQVSVYRHGEKIPEAKPTLTAKTIIPPKLPIEIPQPKTQAAHSPAPPAHSPAPPKAAPGRGVKSPTPTRRK